MNQTFKRIVFPVRFQKKIRNIYIACTTASVPIIVLFTFFTFMPLLINSYSAFSYSIL